MKRVEISLLGPARVCLDGEPIRFRTDSTCALLAYLALHAGLPCRREALAGLLWPEQPEPAAFHNLRQTLLNLRHALGDPEDDSFSTTRHTVQLNLSDNCWADVCAFQAAAAEALAASKAGSAQHAETYESAQRLAAAVALYQGDLLSGFSYPSASFEEWLVVERERLSLQTLEVLCQLAAYHERRAEYELTLRYARRQLELEVWQEKAYRQAMRALALSGERDAALAQYETCRQILAQELGIEPEHETTALRDRIREGAELLSPSATLPHDLRQRPGLPTQLTPFVGREAELALIAERLRDPHCRLLTLVGPGGIGKTRLALQAAAEQQEAFADGVFYVPLGLLTSIDGMVPTISQALGLSPLGAVACTIAPWVKVSNYLRTRNVLLILDGFEHLLMGTDRVTEILRAAPGVKVLITSRAELNLQGEHLLSMRGMGCPPPPRPLHDREREQGVGGSDPVAGYSAVELFLSAARRARPGYEPTPQELQQVAHICRQVQGVPLAILLAASWIKALTPAEIADHLSRAEGLDLDFLAADWRDVPPEQRSVRTVLDRSWSLLSERQRAVLAALAVFRGPFTPAAALEVAGTPLRELLALVGCSMLARSPAGRTAGPRFELHDLLRQYAAEKLASWPDGGAAVRERHCAYYAAAMQGWGDELIGPHALATMAEMEAEVGNWTSAWDWALEHGQVHRLRTAFDSVWRFYKWHIRYREGEMLLRRTVDRLRPSVGRSREARMLVAYALGIQGHLSGAQGRSDLHQQLAQEGLALLEGSDMGDQDACWVKAHALFELVQFADREQAKRMLAQSLALARKAGNRWMVWVALYSQGWMALDGDSPGEARQLFQESLATIRDLGIPGVPALVLTTLARLERLQGRATQAEEEMREAVADYQAVGDWAGVARSLHLLAFLWVTQSQYAQARSLVEQSVSIREELGYREDVAEPLTTLGICAMHLGEYEQAHLRFHASLNIAREFNQRREVARALCCLGAEALAREAYGEAQDWIQQSLVFYQGSESTSLSEYPVELAWTLACLGIAERALGHPQAALEHLRAALPLAARMREDPIVTATTLGGMALTCMDNGHGERATALYALASQEAGPSRWWYDVVGRHVQGAIAALPPEVVQMAQQRGRAQDLWVTARELLEELTSL